MKLLILISVIVCAFAEISDYHEKIGIPLAKRLKQLEFGTEFIFLGHEAPMGAYSYMAGLVIPLDIRESVCGAVLISSTRVLTAAHCMVSDASTITVVLGSLTLFYGGVRVKATGAVNHPGWVPKGFADDIAVMFIPSVTFSNIIQPINLYTESSGLTGVWATISGYGLTGQHQSLSPNQTLNHMQTQVISNKACQKRFRYWNSIDILESHICTRSGDDNNNGCWGDSGGPLVLGSGRDAALIGVVSFGGYSCEVGLPLTFVRVSYYSPWIKTLM